MAMAVQRQRQFLVRPLERIVADTFHVMYYASPHTWNGGMTKWLGVPVLQNPFDMWILQEIIHETEPDFIIETGSAVGGSALFYTTIHPKVKVISIDVQKEMKPEVAGKRITFIKGMSTDKKIIAQVRKMVGKGKVMAVLDSDHTTKNVLAEMNAYGPMVSSGCYMVVCDTNLGGNPIYNDVVKGPGPMRAVEMFFQKKTDFEIDPDREKFFMTFFPNGWLRKK